MLNGDKEEKVEDWELELLGKGEAKVFRGLAARLNFMSLDCPHSQVPRKQSSRDMTKPTIGSWRIWKKVA
eukprot:12417278-Karenia_brevis.AAC.1